MKLSIIIPVYQVENTLNRCIESVLHQDLTDFEVILVDDGSPDDCPKMCDEWALKNPNIRVIHKTNGGLSDARNAGIDVAQGTYTTFIDSDDYLEANTYAPLMQKLTDNPGIYILEYPVFVHYGSPKQHLLQFPDETDYQNIDDYWYAGKAYQHSYACNKIYRTSLFEGVRYPVGVLFEDIHTLPLLLKKAKKVATCNQGLYYYCSNEKGITSTADGKALKMLLEPHVDIIRNSQRQDREAQLYYLHVLNIQMDVYEQTGEAPILPLRSINSRYFDGVLKLKSIALNLLGIKRLCKLNKFIHSTWRSH